MVDDMTAICPECNGSGEVLSHNSTCWECNGSGKITQARLDELTKKEANAKTDREMREFVEANWPHMTMDEKLQVRKIARRANTRYKRRCLPVSRSIEWW